MKAIIYAALLVACGCAPNRKSAEDLEQLRNAVSVLQEANTADSIVLAPSDTRYSVLKTKVGNLLFSCRRVEPYLSGFKVFAEIGNPSSCGFSGIRLTLNWGLGEPDKDDMIPLLRTKEVSIPKEIRAGHWNEIEFVVEPATAEDLKSVVISASVDTVLLVRAPK